MFKSLDELKKKKLYTIVAVILLAAMYIIIFNFSADSGDESSDISARIADFIYKIYYKIVGSGTGAPVEAVVEQADPLEAFIRKLAHFTEYLCVGFLSYGIMLMWYKHKWKGRGLVVLQVFLSGALDEFHQYFVPGRWASFKDVLIDTAGGVAGILLLVGINRKIRSKKKEPECS